MELNVKVPIGGGVAMQISQEEGGDWMGQASYANKDH